MLKSNWFSPDLGLPGRPSLTKVLWEFFHRTKVPPGANIVRRNGDLTDNRPSNLIMFPSFMAMVKSGYGQNAPTQREYPLISKEPYNLRDMSGFLQRKLGLSEVLAKRLVRAYFETLLELLGEGYSINLTDVGVARPDLTIEPNPNLAKTLKGKRRYKKLVYCRRDD